MNDEYTYYDNSVKVALRLLGITGGKIELVNGKKAFPSKYEQSFIEESVFAKNDKLQRLRESCGVYDKGRTIKFRRYSPLKLSDNPMDLEEVKVG